MGATDDKEEQEDFWSRHRKASEAKREKYEAGKEAFRAKVQQNLSTNRERLSKAKEALSRFEEKASDIRSKICDEEASFKWRNIWAEWFEETKTRIANIEEQIDRLNGWIGEDERKLNDID